MENQIKICVIGLGGAGCNTVNRLINLSIPGVNLIAANTDIQSLQRVKAHKKILLGSKFTNGRGAGGDYRIGRKAAEESFREIYRAIDGKEIVFLTAGMGGGTGSGAIEIAARIAQSMDIHTISVVTLPFSFESSQRTMRAREAAIALQAFSDTLITIPNDKLFELATPETSLEAALAISDDYLTKSIQAISSLVQGKGLLNIDMSHILRALSRKGGTYISIGNSSGKNRVKKAIDVALKHPLLENISLKESNSVILQLAGKLTIKETESAMNYLKSYLSVATEIIPAFDPTDLGKGQIQATILATGVGAYSISDISQEFKKQALPVPAEETDIDKLEKQFAFTPANQDIDNYEIPAFIRKGYNLQKSQLQ